MNKTQKIIIGAIVVLVGIIAIGAYNYPKPVKEVPTQLLGGIGDLNATRRIASVSLDFGTTTPTTSTTTGACLLVNNDGRDRIISSIDLYTSSSTTIFGTTQPPGLARWVWQIATSADVYNVQGNKIFTSSVSTTSIGIFVSSSTPGITGVNSTSDFARVWSNGSCLNLLTNGTSTNNTGTLVVGFVPAP